MQLFDARGRRGRMNILGISGAFGHDSAAALVVDGVVVAACEEERFTRSKRAIRQPAMHSIQACLDQAQMTVDDLDCVAIGWEPELAPSDRRLSDSLDQLLSSHRFAHQNPPPVVRVPHHLAHAALGYYTSGFHEAAVLVIDGQSEDASTTIYHGRGSSLVEVARFDIPSSLGFFYAAVTRYAGFSPGSAGKTMGLSALGSPIYDFPEIELTLDGYEVKMSGRSKAERMAGWMQRCEAVFGVVGGRDYSMSRSSGLLRASAPVQNCIRDAAASAQVALERTIRHLAAIARSRTGSTNLVLSGGVALNCSANGRLRQALSGGEMFVNGAVHDGGTALGAALAIAADHHELPEATRSRSMFLGPDFDVSPTIDLARRLGLIVERASDETASLVAKKLSNDAVGAWFRGRAEYGPRALGGRSIIARSDSSDVAARVNLIKGRESWRPLAPAMSPEAASVLGIAGDGLDFMVEARWLDDVAGTPVDGILHVDGSVRPLVVSDPAHPFADLLNSIKIETGTAVLTNTSFNLESEPLVNSPLEALRTFASSDLDFLVLEDSLLTKPA